MHYAQTVCIPGPLFRSGDKASNRVCSFKKTSSNLPLFTGNTQYITFIKKKSVNVPTEGMLN